MQTTCNYSINMLCCPYNTIDFKKKRTRRQMKTPTRKKRWRYRRKKETQKGRLPLQLITTKILWVWMISSPNIGFMKVYNSLLVDNDKCHGSNVRQQVQISQIHLLPRSTGHSFLFLKSLFHSLNCCSGILNFSPSKSSFFIDKFLSIFWSLPTY